MKGADAGSLFDDLVNARQAAEMLGVSQSRVAQLRREHVLTAVESPLGWLYPVAGINQLADARNGHPSHPPTTKAGRR